MLTPFVSPTYLRKIVSVVGVKSLINVLPLADEKGTICADPVTSLNWQYGASNVTLGRQGIDGGSAVLFGGASAGQVTPTAATLTALNVAGQFNPLEGTLAIWGKISAALMADANLYGFAQVGVDNNNRFTLLKNVANTIQFRFAIGGVAVSRTGVYLGGSFVHMALTWSSSAGIMRGFMNGLQQAADLTYSGTWAGTLNATFTQLASIANANYLPGSLQYYLLANRALSAIEIAALANAA